jgi:hypothetical protein
MNVPARRQKKDDHPSQMMTELPEGYEAGTQHNLAVSLAVAEVDQQITTAHAYPRSIERAMKNILSLATLDEESAKECIYALPRDGKAIKGPSIRLAEIIQGQWGNNRCGARVTHVDRIEKYVEAEGATTARVRRRLSDREGRLFNDDMIIVTGNAAAAIAKRNAILGGVPKAIWRRAYQEVERVLIGDVRTLKSRRDDAIKAFAGLGIKPDQLFGKLEIEGLDDIGPDQYTTLVGMFQSIKNNETTVEEMFPPDRKQADERPGSLKGRLDKLAGEDDDKAASATQKAKDARKPSAGKSSDRKEETPADPPAGNVAADPGAGETVDPDTGEVTGDEDAIRQVREAVVDELLAIAGSDAKAGDRLERLEVCRAGLAENYPELDSFIREAARTAAKVIGGEQKAEVARRYLEGL